jgi:hypothetical protein
VNRASVRARVSSKKRPNELAIIEACMPCRPVRRIGGFDRAGLIGTSSIMTCSGHLFASNSAKTSAG